MNLSDQKFAAKTEQTMLILSVALNILSLRFLTVLSLLLNTAVFSWALYSDSWVRLAGAALFAVATWCIVNLKPPKEHQNET
jgi:hypothetical protein